jgi:heterodisulfide reductase subunit C
MAMHNGNERDEVIRRSGVNIRKCMRCGKCSATCPPYDEMEYHPHEFVYMVEKGNLEPLLNSSSLYKCLSCFACIERCPRGVEPAKVVEAVRVSVLRKKEQNRLKPEMIPALLDEDLPQQAIVSAFRKYSK